MAKSKLIIKINSEFSQTATLEKTGDWIGINLLNGGYTVQLDETASNLRTREGLYRRNNYEGDTETEKQARALADAINRDYKDVGAFNNVQASYESAPVPFLPGHYVVIILDRNSWTFDSVVGAVIDNNKAEVVLMTNVAPDTPKTVTLTETTTVDCANKYIDYDIVITGGVAPYTIKGTALGNVVNTDGTETIKLIRGQDTNIVVTDSLGAEIGRKLLVPTIPLLSSYFNVVTSQDGANAKVVVSPNVVLPDSILPLTYSVNGTDYQSLGSFTGLDFEENYTAYIKDKFGCVVSKAFVTPVEDSNQTIDDNYPRVLQISNGGSLIWKELVTFDSEAKKNFTNTLSCEEIVGIPRSYIHEFIANDIVVFQWKSSYTYHRVTLVTDDGKIDLSEVMQAQNIGIVEKVDCKLFRDADGALGVYFRNGAKYIEGTTTENGESSEYSATNLPSWQGQGSVITIDGIGAVTIKRVGNDVTRGLYLQTNASYTSLTDDDGKVQANYNRQNYNLFESAFIGNNLPDTGRARIVIEAGFNNLVERVFVTELIQKITDTNDHYLFIWYDPENKSNIVHQTQIKHLARLKANLVYVPVSESETADYDSGTMNLEQKVFSTVRLRIAVYGYKMTEKLHIAAGMEDFYINGINYRKTKFESEIQGDSNTYVSEGEFRLGANLLGVNENELVLHDPLTGITEKPSIPSTIPTFLGIGGGGLLLNGNGGFFLVE